MPSPPSRHTLPWMVMPVRQTLRRRTRQCHHHTRQCHHHTRDATTTRSPTFYAHRWPVALAAAWPSPWSRPWIVSRFCSRGPGRIMCDMSVWRRCSCAHACACARACAVTSVIMLCSSLCSHRHSLNRLSVRCVPCHPSNCAHARLCRNGIVAHSHSFVNIYIHIRLPLQLSPQFQGHSAMLLRIFPSAAIRFMAYEQYKMVGCQPLSVPVRARPCIHQAFTRLAFTRALLLAHHADRGNDDAI